jgi:hypothetical protein
MESFRDLIIIIFGITGTIAAIILVVMAFVLYSRAKPILDSLKKTTDTIARITSSVEEAVAKPLAQVMSFVKGVRSALGLVKKFTGKEED